MKPFGHMCSTTLSMVDLHLIDAAQTAIFRERQEWPDGNMAEFDPLPVVPSNR